MTTLFPIYGFRAANEQVPARSGGGDADTGRSGAVFDLSSHRRRIAERIAAIYDADLHAYVDACLEAGRRAHVEAQLASDPEAGPMAAAYRRLNVNLHRLFDRDLPPLTASLEALSRELDRRLGVRRQARGLAGTRGAAEAVVGRLADAVHRASLGERLAGTGLLCRAGDPDRAEQELARLEYETRRSGR